MITKSGLGSRPPRPREPLSLEQQFRGARLVVIGGTGFLGKVWWVLMLDRFPAIEQLYLVVRPRNGQSAEQRFYADIATSDCLTPLRQRYGEGFDAFLRSKITVIDGDIVRPSCGIAQHIVDSLRGRVSAVVNASGIVDFQPPLDIALEVNAFGMQSLVQLARDLGNVPVLHTSTCYVAGNRPGIVEELNPLDFPFPNAEHLDQNLWDPDREIAECLDIIEQAKHRANDAFRESHFLDQAKRNLVSAGEPAKGAVLEAEVGRVRRRFVEQQLAAFGQERAKFWGWPNTYTYTKSIGEQIVAKSNLPFTIVRPAIVESCTKFPLVGWNEGVNTSAPLIFAVREGQFQFPGAAIRLDIIPCDMVATGITLALAELLEGTAKPVYQFGTSDSNPTTMARIYELSGLYKRRHWQTTGRGGPVVGFLQSHLEGALMPTKRFDQIGPRAVSKGMNWVADFLDKAPPGAVQDMIEPSKQTLRRVARQQGKIADIVGQFAPFTADLDYEFRCDNTRSANARLSEAERSSLYWAPESMDWRDWFLNVHVPGLERWVFPELETRLRRPLRPLKRHPSLNQLIEEMAERHGLAVALQRAEADGLSRISYQEWYARSLACAARLQQAGVQKGDRVALCAKNHPDWPIAFFGILLAGGTVVPVAHDSTREAAKSLFDEAEPKLVVFDEAARLEFDKVRGTRPVLLATHASAPGPAGSVVPVGGDDIAVWAQTGGRNETPKGVLLSHQNLTSVVAQLAPLFPLSKDDRLLSVLSLHQPYELTAGLLLPLSRGARVVYLDDASNHAVERAMREGLITSVVAVPELWQRLQAEVLSRVQSHGPLASRAFDLGLELNRLLGTTLGVDAGRLLFGPVHNALGGRLRTIVSGGGTLDAKTHAWFAGLGLHVSEGYGLTEASPVVSVSNAGPRSRPGNVGRAIPGVEVRIDAADADGVGEVLVRGPNVMVGYAKDDDSTRRVLEPDGWLHTGDRGRLDDKGRLFIAEARSETPTEEPRAQKRPAAGLPPLLDGVRSSSWFEKARRGFLDNVVRPRVIGRAFVPQDAKVVVVVQQASALNEGLVRFALGDDFANVTWMRGEAVAVLERALAALSGGGPVLLESGTEQSEGSDGEMDSLIGQVALGAGVSVLPVGIDGVPQGLRALTSKGGQAVVRIGPKLDVERLRGHTRGLTPEEGARRVGSLVRRALSELAQGRGFELPEPGAAGAAPFTKSAGSSSAAANGAGSSSSTASAGSAVSISAAFSNDPVAPAPSPPVLGPLAPVFDELEARFEPGVVRKPVSYYFSLGTEKFTLKLTADSYQLERGLTVAKADCVVKTTPELFRRMVMDGYTPGAREVMTGSLKSNNTAALKDLQRIFDLKSQRRARRPSKVRPDGSA